MIKFKNLAPKHDFKIVFADTTREPAILSGSVGFIADLIRKYNKEGIEAKIYYKKNVNWILLAE